MSDKYTLWTPVVYSKLESGDQVKYYGDVSNSNVLEVVRTIPPNTHVPELGASSDANEYMLFKCLRDGDYAALTKREIEADFDMMRFLNEVTNQLLAKPDSIDRSKWNINCKYCNKPAYYCEVWGRLHCTAKCPNSYQGPFHV